MVVRTIYVSTKGNDIKEVSGLDEIVIDLTRYLKGEAPEEKTTNIYIDGNCVRVDCESGKVTISKTMRDNYDNLIDIKYIIGDIGNDKYLVVQSVNEKSKVLPWQIPICNAKQVIKDILYEMSRGNIYGTLQSIATYGSREDNKPPKVVEIFGLGIFTGFYEI